MRLLPAYFGARKRVDDDQAPPTEPGDQSRADIFNLIPPRASEKYERPEKPEKTDKPDAPEKIEGRNVHAVNTMDLTRLSIDNDGRLYWNGKPVEVRRRITMSRAQAIGTSLIASFIVIGALGSAIQATAVVHDWACRNGWTSNCALPAPPAMPRPSPRLDIPA